MLTGCAAIEADIAATADAVAATEDEAAVITTDRLIRKLDAMCEGER